MADKGNKSSYQPQKKSIVLRVIIIAVAALMTFGVVALPFIYSGMY